MDSSFLAIVSHFLSVPCLTQWGEVWQMLPAASDGPENNQAQTGAPSVEQYIPNRTLTGRDKGLVEFISGGIEHRQTQG